MNAMQQLVEGAEDVLAAFDQTAPAADEVEAHRLGGQSLRTLDLHMRMRVLRDAVGPAREALAVVPASELEERVAAVRAFAVATRDAAVRDAQDSGGYLTALRVLQLLDGDGGA